ncbi:MAG: ABC-2 family transporter protein [Candidatus Peribacteraceae bacterium]|nr:ABC-2 family transporter protein [Candidatus Peribacteraceae bacterium]
MPSADDFMRYYLSILRRATILHLLQWSRYRADTVIWTITIWLTLGIQGLFLSVTYHASGGNLFGYSGQEVIGFFGVALMATGLAQSITVGVIRTISKAVWGGNFDHWLLQPPPILFRIVTEELGFIWYWPHVVVGTGIILYAFPFTLWPVALISAIIAGTIEMGIVLLLCLPTIRWGRWNPYEGLWEYIENARSVPIGRSRNIMLWLASFGVLQYSLALEVITGRLPLLLLLLFSAGVWALVLLLLRIFLRSYGSASS